MNTGNRYENGNTKKNMNVENKYIKIKGQNRKKGEIKNKKRK